MLHPLITLWRHRVRVTFYESGSPSDGHLFARSAWREPASVAGNRRAFASHDEARHYLRFWMGDPAGRSELTWLLNRGGARPSAARTSADDWVDTLAHRLFSGDLVVLEEAARWATPGRLHVSSGGASTSSTAALASMPPLSSVPAVPLLPPLLPALENVMIEGAEVMPEIDQSLEQVALAKTQVQATTAGLASSTAPIVDIQSAIDAASAEANATLGSA